MQVAIDLSTRSIVNWDGSVLTGLSMTCRDKFYIDVRFIEGGQSVELQAGARGILRFKVPGAWDGPVRAAATEWVKLGSERSAFYRFYLRLDTVALADLFVGEPDSVDLSMEIEWAYPVSWLNDATEFRQTTLPFTVSISNDYIRENDGIPIDSVNLKATQQDAEAGVSNEKWMTPQRTRNAVERGALASVGFAPLPSPPQAPATGKKLFLNASGDFFTVDASGGVESIVKGVLPVIFSATPPANPAETQRWINESDLRAYEFLDGVWVQTSCSAA